MMTSKMIKKEEMEKILKLSNINITQDEQDNYSKDLASVISYNIGKVEKIKTEGVSPAAHATGEKSITREDITEPSLSEEEATRNTTNKHNKLFKVKHVFGGD